MRRQDLAGPLAGLGRQVPVLDPARHLVEQRVRVAGHVAHRVHVLEHGAVGAHGLQAAVDEHAVARVEPGALQPLGVRVRADRDDQHVALEHDAARQDDPLDARVADEAEQPVLAEEAHAVGLVSPTHLGAEQRPERPLQRDARLRDDRHARGSRLCGRCRDLAADEARAENHHVRARAQGLAQGHRVVDGAQHVDAGEAVIVDR